MSYLYPTFLYHSDTVRQTCAALVNLDFDSIAFCGYSGAIVAPCVAHILGKNLVGVRKTTRICHSTSMVEGVLDGLASYVIIDDCCESGKTVRHIARQIYGAARKANCVGMYLYGQPNMEIGVPCKKPRAKIRSLTATIRGELLATT